MRRLLAWMLVLILAGHCAVVFAEERLTRFHVDLDLTAPGRATVVETITFVAEHSAIKNGLFRDLVYDPYFDRPMPGGIEIVSVRRDGVDEPYRLERISGGYRMLIGRPGTLLATGSHTYCLTYRTGDRLIHSEKGDMSAWDVTGFWPFLIDLAEAQVTLPKGWTVLATHQHAGTAEMSDGAVSVDRNGNIISFKADGGLQPGSRLLFKLMLDRHVNKPLNQPKQPQE